jgi:putative proteasome-type protease
MTYCLGILTRKGVVLASDSRTNSGADKVNVCRKMHTFVKDGDRVLVLLTSGSLSLSQSVITLLRRDFDQGRGLAEAETMYDAARVIGEQIRIISALDREALERDDFRFNVNILLGGQIRGDCPALYMIYSQGNPLMATEDSPFLQIGESKYGRPILDRGVRFDSTTLEAAAKYALISIDSTMRSNATVGPPIDLLIYAANTFKIHGYHRFSESDPELQEIQRQWEQSLRRAVQELPPVTFHTDSRPPDVPALSTPVQEGEARQCEGGFSPASAEPSLDTTPSGQSTI